MIEFVTLFLGGLVIGFQPVEIMAGDGVAIVEVRLDGELEESLSAPPWRLEVDFGSELAPHVLEAVALDGKGEELARARQWVNLSPEPAQTSMMIEGANLGQGAVARLSWESVAESEEPESVEAYFDGLPLDANDPRSIQLPTFDPNQTHHLRVRLWFTDLLYSEVEEVFGGAYGSEVSTEISALPIWFDRGKRPKSAQSMRGWFSVAGVAQNIHAVEKGPAEILVVRDVATASRLSELAEQSERLETDVHLKNHYRITFVSTCPKAYQREGHRQLVFPQSRRFSRKDGTLLDLLDSVVPAYCNEPRQQLADAVGIAGLSANGVGSRRVVLLIISSQPRDKSSYAPAQMIAYLERLRVPLLIWDVGRADAPETAWGQASNVRKLRRVGRAYNLVAKNLERQLIVWLEGLHLPQAVELHPEVEGISLLE